MAYTIVSFCGGGIRGLISLKALKMLAQHKPKILTGTSLLAGSSIGATIVSALMAKMSPEAIIEDLLGAAAQSFSRAGRDPQTPALPLARLVEAQQKLHGTRTLASYLPQQLLFTAFNLGAAPRDGGRATPWQPLLFTNVPSPLASTPKAQIVEAVASSEAMPGMFSPFNGNVDGAFVNHDPTLAAIALAVSSGIALEDIAVICLGTGFMESWIGSESNHWGTDQWLRGGRSGDYRLPPLLVNETGTCPILNLCLNGTSTNLIPLLSQMLLGSRYVYLNPVLDNFIPETAFAPELLQELLTKGEELRSSPSWQPAIDLLDTFW